MVRRASAALIMSLLAYGCSGSSAATDGGGTGTGGAAGGGGTAAGSGGTAGSGNPDAGAQTDAGAPTGCTADGRLLLRAATPDILILLERGASMLQAPDGTTCTTTDCSKWARLTPPIGVTVTATGTFINWGLLLFGSGGARSCDVDVGTVIAPAPQNRDAIMGAIQATMPATQTPTRTAVQRAGEYLAGLTAPNPRYVVLMTDGGPNCATPMAASTDDTGATVNALYTLAQTGVPIFVVGLGIPDGSGMLSLSYLAQAGGVPRATSAEYYEATGEGALLDALAEIASAFGDCTFPLRFPAPTSATVQIDGRAATASPTDGWDFGPGRISVRLHGALCDQLKAGAITDVSLIGACPGA